MTIIALKLKIKKIIIIIKRDQNYQKMIEISTKPKK